MNTKVTAWEEEEREIGTLGFQAGSLVKWKEHVLCS